MATRSIIFLILAGLALSYGEEARASNARIVEGSLAREGQFPYAVSIQLLGQENQIQAVRGHKCGGALFAPSFVVTAASCLQVEDSLGNSRPLLPSEIRVFGGAVQLTNDTSADRVRAVSNITIHPRYTGAPAFVHNIAVLGLSNPFPQSAVTPIALASANFNPPDFTSCFVTGWGGTDMWSNATVELRFTEKYIYNQDQCTTIYNSGLGVKNILPSMVCAVSFDLLTSNCNGDYGNALVCGGTFTGILSRSDGCSVSTFPEVYTRISNHTSWLRTISGTSAIYAPGVFVTMAVFALMQIFFTA